MNRELRRGDLDFYRRDQRARLVKPAFVSRLSNVPREVGMQWRLLAFRRLYHLFRCDCAVIGGGDFPDDVGDFHFHHAASFFPRPSRTISPENQSSNSSVSSSWHLYFAKASSCGPKPPIETIRLNSSSSISVTRNCPKLPFPFSCRKSPTPAITPAAAMRFAIAVAFSLGCTNRIVTMHAQAGTIARVRISGVRFMSALRTTLMSNSGTP